MTKNKTSFVRFGIRSLLAMLSLASIILAITVPYIQSQPVKLQGPMYWAIGVVGALAVVVFSGLCFYRLWIERISGALLFQPKQSFWMRWIFACLMVPLFLVILVVCSQFATKLIGVSSAFPDEQIFSMQANLLVAGALIFPISALIVTTVLPFWGLGIMSLEVRKRGVIVSGWKFHAWSSGVIFETQPAKKPDRLVLSIIRGTSKNITIIHSDEREPLEKHLLDVGIQLGKGVT